MISEYFDKKELACPHCGYIPAEGIADELIMFIDNLQYNVEEKIQIESCIRCEEYNHRINGYKNSYHFYGLAVNIYVPDNYTTEEFIELCYDLGAKNISITDRDNVIHVDFA